MEVLLPELVKLGIPGFLGAVLLYAWINAEKRCDRLTERIQQLHDTFLENAKETVKHIESSTNALTVLREMQQEREESSRDIKVKLDQLALDVREIQSALNSRIRK